MESTRRSRGRRTHHQDILHEKTIINKREKKMKGDHNCISTRTFLKLCKCTHSSACISSVCRCTHPHYARRAQKLMLRCLSRSFDTCFFLRQNLLTVHETNQLTGNSVRCPDPPIPVSPSTEVAGMHHHS